jgi:diguanylate cyclase (GGDEF)-like protein
MKILLAEDSRSLAAAMQARLSALGHDVIVARDGIEAVDRYCQQGPDLILMDIEMPSTNGFEAASRIRAIEAAQKWAWTPIIFLTAYDSLSNLIQAIEAGGDDYLTKMAPEGVLEAKMRAMERIARMRRGLIEANRKLEQMANRDGLTGLANRRYMDHATDEAWFRACHLGSPFAIMMLDVDRFKNYNDHYGHLAGDDCLRAIGRTLEAVVTDAFGVAASRTALPARYGGEEFAVILAGQTWEVANAMADRLLQAVMRQALPHALNPPWQIVTVSVGIAAIAQARDEVADLFRRADACLYQAKQSGRNRIVSDRI